MGIRVIVNFQRPRTYATDMYGTMAFLYSAADAAGKRNQK